MTTTRENLEISFRPHWKAMKARALECSGHSATTTAHRCLSPDTLILLVTKGRREAALFILPPASEGIGQ